MLTVAVVMTVASSVLLIALPGVAQSAVVSSLEFTVTRVIPSLFCFMVLSRFASTIDAARILKPLLKPVTKLLHLSDDESGCFITGNLCGFPTGAALCSDLINKNGYSGNRAVTLVTASNNISAGFMISFVGAGIFGSQRLGAILWACQFAASICVCAFLRRKINPEDLEKKKYFSDVNVSSALVDAVKGGASSSLYLTGFIVTFTVISAYAEHFMSVLGLPDAVSAAVTSFLEVTRGCSAASVLGEPLSIILVSFSAGFSGLCVIFQSASFFVKSGVSIKNYISVKLAHGILSALFALACYYIFV